MKVLVILLTSILLFCHPLSAKIIRVPQDSVSIQSGIEGAVDGDTVLVVPGTYFENLNLRGKKILLASNFIFDSLTATIQSTVIDGQKARVIVCNSGEDSSSTICGFTIQNGILDGAGVFCVESSPSIRNNFFIHNDALHRMGCGIRCIGSDAQIIGNVFAENLGATAVYVCYGSKATIVNNTICFNPGGGIACQVNSPAIIKNNIISNNGRYGIYVRKTSPVMDYNNVWNNDDNDYQGIEPGVHDISQNPLFCKSSVNKYALSNISPCVGKGDNRANMGALGVACHYDFVVEVTAFAHQNGIIGEPNQLSLNVHNRGLFLDTYEISVDDTLGWDISPSFLEFTLGPEQGESLEVNVFIPVDVVPKTEDKVIFTVYSQSNPISFDTDFVSFQALKPYQVEVSAEKDTTWFEEIKTQVNFKIRNAGFHPDTYDIFVTDSLGYRIEPDFLVITLDSEKDTTLSFMVTPASIRGGEINKLRLFVNSSNIPSFSPLTEATTILVQ